MRFREALGKQMCGIALARISVRKIASPTSCALLGGKPIGITRGRS
jgi:hypothetical protein